MSKKLDGKYHGVRFKTALTGYILSGDFTGAIFDGISLNNATLSGIFINASFKGTKLRNAGLRYGNFLGADFTRADLREARVNMEKLKQQAKGL